MLKCVMTLNRENARLVKSDTPTQIRVFTVCMGMLKDRNAQTAFTVHIRVMRINT